MARDFRNKIAMITGAASGIGKATATLLAEAEAKVLLVDRNESVLAAAARELSDRDLDVEISAVDVATSSGARTASERCMQAFGGLDVLVSNAGINPRGTVLDTPDELLEQVLAVNLKAAFYLCRYCIPLMQRRGGGSIVTVASINALVAWKNEAAYEASKGGLLMLTRAVAVDFADQAIRANCVCPGVTSTPMLERTIGAATNAEAFRKSLDGMQPLGRTAKPTDIARAIVFLASDEAAYITGAVLPVDGGYTAV